MGELGNQLSVYRFIQLLLNYKLLSSKSYLFVRKFSEIMDDVNKWDINKQDVEIIKEVLLKNIQIMKIKEHRLMNEQNEQKLEPIYKDSYPKSHLILQLKFEAESFKIQIQRAIGGLVNNVYILGQHFAIKIESLIEGITTHQIQLMRLMQQAQIKAPRLIDSGQIKGKKYILMTRLEGDKLWRYWPALTENQREKAMEQICFQLKKLHSIKFSQFSPRRPYKFKSMKEALHWYLQKQIQEREESLKNINYPKKSLEYLKCLRQYLNKHIQILNQDPIDDPVLVHNDLHMGNILYNIEKKEITGFVDFDFSRQMNKDYQLWHIIYFLDNPAKYIEEKYRQSWKLSSWKITNQLKYIKKYYKQLFYDPHHNIAIRIKLYLIEEILLLFNQNEIDLFNKKFQDYYIGDTLDSYFQSI